MMAVRVLFTVIFFAFEAASFQLAPISIISASPSSTSWSLGSGGSGRTPGEDLGEDTAYTDRRRFMASTLALGLGLVPFRASAKSGDPWETRWEQTSPMLEKLR